jgi:hypothetical protein
LRPHFGQPREKNHTPHETSLKEAVSMTVLLGGHVRDVEVLLGGHGQDSDRALEILVLDTNLTFFTSTGMANIF